jgi:cytochrome oxidase Cu insertion factor (SCO1/SenC/PrrC family)
MNTPIDIRSRNRSRAMLLLIVAIFMAPFVAALVLYYSDWKPTHTKNYGELLKSPRDLRDLDLRRADGSAFAWHHEDHTWRVLVVPAEHCGDGCTRLADALRRDWIGLGKDADRVQVLWVGDVPATEHFAALVPLRPTPALQERLPDRAGASAIPVYVVDPSGYLILRYPPGFDPVGLRKDLAQLLK